MGPGSIIALSLLVAVSWNVEGESPDEPSGFRIPGAVAARQAPRPPAVAVKRCTGRAVVAAAENGAVAPKLEAVDRPASDLPATADDDAKPLPATVTICQDASAQRCWTESGATECAADAHRGAKVFRQVGSNNDPGTALKECWTDLDR